MTYEEAIQKSINGFKDHSEAYQSANVLHPANEETVKQLRGKRLRTREDFRWFVLMNYIRSIDAALNKHENDTFQRQVQDNILAAAERYL